VNVAFILTVYEWRREKDAWHLASCRLQVVHSEL
jgi:hypothetical protein